MNYFKSALAFFFLFFLHGFSIGNGQQGISYNTLVKQLLEVKGKRFLSIEPQLDFISIPSDLYKGIDWIIQGGESGPNKRPFNLDWAYSMKQDCKDLHIPFFFKQIDKILTIPEDLMVREFYH